MKIVALGFSLVFFVVGCSALQSTQESIYRLEIGDRIVSIQLPTKVSKDFRTMTEINYLSYDDQRFDSSKYNSVLVNSKKYDFGNPPFSISGTLSMTMVVYKMTDKDSLAADSLSDLSEYLVQRAASNKGTIKSTEIRTNMNQQPYVFYDEYRTELFQYQSHTFPLRQGYYIQLHFRHIDNASSEKAKQQFRAQT